MLTFSRGLSLLLNPKTSLYSNRSLWHTSFVLPLPLNSGIQPNLCVHFKMVCKCSHPFHKVFSGGGGRRGQRGWEPEIAKLIFLNLAPAGISAFVYGFLLVRMLSLLCSVNRILILNFYKAWPFSSLSPSGCDLSLFSNTQVLCPLWQAFVHLIGLLSWRMLKGGHSGQFVPSL